MRTLLFTLLLAGGAIAADPFSDLRQQLDRNPSWQEGWWKLGSAFYEADRYAEAADALSRLTQLRPAAGPAWALLGLSEYETARYGPALEHIDKSLVLGVGDQPQMAAVLRFHQALLLTRERRFDRALQRYSQFVPKQVNDRQLQLGLGLLALRRAAVPSEVAAADLPLVADAGQAMAVLLTESPAASVATFRQIADTYGDAPGVQFSYAFAVYATDSEASVTALGRELTHHPSNASAHSLLAWIYFLRDEPSVSLHHARAALAIDPQLSVPNILLGRAETDAGQTATALSRLKAVAEREPENLEAHLALASAYSAAGETANARSERQLAIHLRTVPVAQP